MMGAAVFAVVATFLAAFPFAADKLWLGVPTIAGGVIV